MKEDKEGQGGERQLEPSLTVAMKIVFLLLFLRQQLFQNEG